MIAEALIYAKAAHCAVGQKRKYTGEDYYHHPIDVANMLLSCSETTVTDEMVSAALLHDVVEDTSVTLEQICDMFGMEVMMLVEQLTAVSKPEDGNRAIRKEIDRQHTALASPEAKTIKLADLISNLSSIVALDPDFAKVYMREKKLLLEVLTEGDPALYKMAKGIVDDYYELHI